ncbi:hypothetical protein ACTXT7_011460 [Hymenolepis weldensis]
MVYTWPREGGSSKRLYDVASRPKMNVKILPIQGMGTALKILFTDGLFDVAEDGRVKLRPSTQLKRSEIVSLFNGFAKFAKSINYYVKLREMFINQLKHRTDQTNDSQKVKRLGSRHANFMVLPEASGHVSKMAASSTPLHPLRFLTDRFIKLHDSNPSVALE